MSADDGLLWQAKLHARLRDPAENALALLRDPVATARPPLREPNAALHTLLFENGSPPWLRSVVDRADRWAAAADRPQWPGDDPDPRTPSRTRVRWTDRPLLIHPLTGQQVNLDALDHTTVDDLERHARGRFEALVQRTDDGETDWRRTALAFWRFGPEPAATDRHPALADLWPHLPGDIRVPDHSLWDHLDLASAFVGAFAADRSGDAALLAVSIGPVQPFIAAARTTSDLWAGSHLLARLSWEAAKVICERLGPDAVLFPRLRGLPQVDVWLMRDCGLPTGLFEHCDWRHGNTDGNPLFAAALPNRFVAAVPAGDAKALAADVEKHVRLWLQSLGEDVVEALLRAAGEPVDPSLPAYAQMRDQLDGFPEVHWAAVPFSLIRCRDAERQTDPDTTALSAAMAPFFAAGPDAAPGFLGTDAWRALREEIRWSDDDVLLAPGPGVLYPAVHDLAERVLAAAKAVRPFGQTRQHGWRCSLTGETEWLTTDRAHLGVHHRRRTDTLWAKVAAAHPAWAKEGEHLGALAAVKRLWPTLFAREVGEAVGAGAAAQRFVVSTHTMALARQLQSWPARGAHLPGELEERLMPRHAVALPRGLAQREEEAVRRLPGLLDEVRDGDDEAERARVERLVKQAFAGTGTGATLESYYALLLFDGDHMGRILAGDPAYAVAYRDTLHPHLRDVFDEHAARNPQLAAYGAQKRPMSPHRHLAVSGALNDFALHVVPHIVEREHLGRVVYAGGDDVLAMLPATDLLGSMQRLRTAYSGDSSGRRADDDKERPNEGRLTARDGFVRLPRAGHRPARLLRMMGGATASCGAVVVHYQTPLAAALSALRAAEHRAKNDGGRDAFALSILKRAGGSLQITAKWPVSDILDRLRAFLAEPAVSRRAVYNTVAWIEGLPSDADHAMLRAMLALQFRRQTGSKDAADRHDLPQLAAELAQAAVDEGRARWNPWLRNTLSVAEFLARELRAPGLPGHTPQATR